LFETLIHLTLAFNMVADRPVSSLGHCIASLHLAMDWPVQKNGSASFKSIGWLTAMLIEEPIQQWTDV